MTKIYITKLNESYCYVESDDDVEEILQEYFSFQVQNYEFMPAFKRGWDGFIRLYNPNNKLLYTGLINEVENFSNNSGHTVVFEDKSEIVELDDYSIEYIEEWLDKQIVAKKGEELELRDYQFDIVVQCIKSKRLTVKAATSAGKSAIIYLITKFLFEHGKRVLIQTVSKNLIEQLYNDFIDYSSLNDFDVDLNVQKISSDYKEKRIVKSIVIATWQSTSSNIKKDKNFINNNYDCIINDETHQIDADSITKIFESATAIAWRFGLTGSLKKTKINKMVVEGLIGKIYKSITLHELIQRGEAAPLAINMLYIDYEEEFLESIKKLDYHKLSEILINHTERNKFLIKLAAEKPGNSLILFNSDSHGKELVRLATEMYPDIKIFFINSSVRLSDEREKIRQEIERTEKCILVGSYGTVSTGFSVNNLFNMIMAFPYKSITRILQSLGRMARLHPNKTKSNIYDICDVLGKKTSKNRKILVFTRHATERATIYTDEKLKFKTFNLKLKTNALSKK